MRVTDDELRQLVEELGLGGNDAGDLIKGLGGEPEPPEESGDITKGKERGKEVSEQAQEVEAEEETKEIIVAAAKSDDAGSEAIKSTPAEVHKLAD